MTFNLKALSSLLSPETGVIAVVKADAYGHGAMETARHLTGLGVPRLAVALVEEGVELRRAGITAPTIIMADTPPQQAGLVAEHDLEPAVYTPELVAALAAAARRAGRRVGVHLKADTGLGRIGTRSPEEAVALARDIAARPELSLAGVFTHFASAEEPDLSYTHRQLDRFRLVLTALEQAGCRLPLRHASNTAAAVMLPPARLDAVRLGLGLYGYLPGAHMGDRVRLRPAMRFVAQVTHIKRLPAGEYVSYGCTWRAPGERLIATVPVGYADGYNRLLSNCGRALIRGRRCPVVGQVCMDQLMLDVTDIDGAAVGDWACFLGPAPAPDAAELAAATGTISHEILTSITRRVPRVYFKQGRSVRSVYPRGPGRDQEVDDHPAPTGLPEGGC